MIREILKPTSNNLTISIPNEYVNKELEFIIFPIKTKKLTQKTKQQDISTLAGCLNKYVNLSKIDLENKAWQKHIIDKYKI